MFNWFSTNPKNSNETIAKPNKASMRLDNYINDHEEEEEEGYEKEDSIHRDHLIDTNRHNSPEDLIRQRDQILKKNIEATERATQELNSNHSHKTLEQFHLHIPQPKESLEESMYHGNNEEDLDYTEADMETVLRNLEEDPYADTSEILEESLGNKVVEITVIFDRDNTLGERIYAFNTKSYTSFYEEYADQLYHSDSFTAMDIKGERITIYPKKCYSVKMKECKY